MSFGLLAVSLCLAAAALGAQVVRGVVREAESGVPLSGVLVALEAADGAAAGGSAGRAAPVIAVLSNERGEFALSTGRPGQFVLSAKRIGVQRYVSPPMLLAEGETKSLSITVERLHFELPSVAVTATSLCSRKPSESRRIASLWEETRAALTATQISMRDRLFRSTITRYVRTLQVPGLRVLQEDQSVQHGVSEQPFVSFAAESLSAIGYARDVNGQIEYFAPDAAVLLSDSFVRDHCFAVAAGRDARNNLVGLAFEPVGQRELADIRGTMWLDARTFELRLVEFRYVNLDLPVEDPRIGGEVHFAPLRSGAWIVSRWFIRMPGLGRANVAVAPGTPTSYASARVNVVQFREEGGDVVAEDDALGGASSRRLASLTGRVVDSTGQLPLRNATVRVSGTRHVATVRSDGSFRLDSLAAGSYTLRVEHPAYALFGVSAAEQDLTIEEEGLSRTLIRALGNDQLLRLLCGGDEPVEDEGALRVVLRDGATGAPLPDTEVRLSWSTFSVQGANGLSKTPKTVIARTDERGAATFCGAPARTMLQVEVPRNGRDEPERRLVTLDAGRVVALEVRR